MNIKSFLYLLIIQFIQLNCSSVLCTSKTIQNETSRKIASLQQNIDSRRFLTEKSNKQRTSVQSPEKKFLPSKFLAQIKLMREYPKAFSEMIQKKYIVPEKSQDTIIKAVQRKVLLSSHKKLSAIKTDLTMMKLAEKLSKKLNDETLTDQNAKAYLNDQIKQDCQTYDYVSYQTSFVDTNKYKNLLEWMLREIVHNDSAQDLMLSDKLNIKFGFSFMKSKKSNELRATYLYVSNSICQHKKNHKGCQVEENKKYCLAKNADYKNYLNKWESIYRHMLKLKNVKIDNRAAKKEVKKLKESTKKIELKSSKPLATKDVSNLKVNHNQVSAEKTSNNVKSSISKAKTDSKNTTKSNVNKSIPKTNLPTTQSKGDNKNTNKIFDKYQTEVESFLKELKLKYNIVDKVYDKMFKKYKQKREEKHSLSIKSQKEKGPKEQKSVQSKISKPTISKLSQEIKTLMENYKALYLKKNLIQEAINKSNYYKTLINSAKISQDNVETAHKDFLKAKHDKKVSKDVASTKFKFWNSKKELLKEAKKKMLIASEVCKKWVKKVSLFQKNELKMKKLNLNIQNAKDKLSHIKSDNGTDNKKSNVKALKKKINVAKSKIVSKNKKQMQLVSLKIKPLSNYLKTNISLKLIKTLQKVKTLKKDLKVLKKVGKENNAIIRNPKNINAKDLSIIHAKKVTKSKLDKAKLSLKHIKINLKFKTDIKKHKHMVRALVTENKKSIKESKEKLEHEKELLTSHKKNSRNVKKIKKKIQKQEKKIELKKKKQKLLIQVNQKMQELKKDSFKLKKEFKKSKKSLIHAKSQYKNVKKNTNLTQKDTSMIPKIQNKVGEARDNFHQVKTAKTKIMKTYHKIASAIKNLHVKTNLVKKANQRENIMKQNIAIDKTTIKVLKNIVKKTSKNHKLKKIVSKGIKMIVNERKHLKNLSKKKEKNIEHKQKKINGVLRKKSDNFISQVNKWFQRYYRFLKELKNFRGKQKNFFNVIFESPDTQNRSFIRKDLESQDKALSEKLRKMNEISEHIDSLKTPSSVALRKKLLKINLKKKIMKNLIVKKQKEKFKLAKKIYHKKNNKHLKNKLKKIRVFLKNIKQNERRFSNKTIKENTNLAIRTTKWAFSKQFLKAKKIWIYEIQSVLDNSYFKKAFEIVESLHKLSKNDPDYKSKASVLKKNFDQIKNQMKNDDKKVKISGKKLQNIRFKYKMVKNQIRSLLSEEKIKGLELTIKNDGKKHKKIAKKIKQLKYQIKLNRKNKKGESLIKTLKLLIKKFYANEKINEIKNYQNFEKLINFYNKNINYVDGINSSYILLKLQNLYSVKKLVKRYLIKYNEKYGQIFGMKNKEIEASKSQKNKSDNSKKNVYNRKFKKDRKKLLQIYKKLIIIQNEIRKLIEKLQDARLRKYLSLKKINFALRKILNKQANILKTQIIHHRGEIKLVNNGDKQKIAQLTKEIDLDQKKLLKKNNEIHFQHKKYFWYRNKQLKSQITRLNSLISTFDMKIQTSEKITNLYKEDVRLIKDKLNNFIEKKSSQKKIDQCSNMLENKSKVIKKINKYIGDLKKKRLDLSKKIKIIQQNIKMVSIIKNDKTIKSQLNNLQNKHEILIDTAHNNVKAKNTVIRNKKIAQNIKHMNNLKTKIQKNKKEIKAAIKDNQKAIIDYVADNKKVSAKYTKKINVINSKVVFANKTIKAAKLTQKVKGVNKKKLKEDIKRAQDIKASQLKLKMEITKKASQIDEKTTNMIINKNPNIQIRANILRILNYKIRINKLDSFKKKKSIDSLTQKMKNGSNSDISMKKHIAEKKEQFNLIKTRIEKLREMLKKNQIPKNKLVEATKLRVEKHLHMEEDNINAIEKARTDNYRKIKTRLNNLSVRLNKDSNRLSIKKQKVIKQRLLIIKKYYKILEKSYARLLNLKKKNILVSMHYNTPTTKDVLANVSKIDKHSRMIILKQMLALAKSQKLRTISVLRLNKKQALVMQRVTKRASKTFKKVRKQYEKSLLKKHNKKTSEGQLIKLIYKTYNTIYNKLKSNSAQFNNLYKKSKRLSQFQNKNAKRVGVIAKMIREQLKKTSKSHHYKKTNKFFNKRKNHRKSYSFKQKNSLRKKLLKISKKSFGFENGSKKMWKLINKPKSKLYRSKVTYECKFSKAKCFCRTIKGKKILLKNVVDKKTIGNILKFQRTKNFRLTVRL